MVDWKEAIAKERLSRQEKLVEQKQKSTEIDKAKQGEVFKISKDDL